MRKLKLLFIILLSSTLAIACVDADREYSNLRNYSSNSGSGSPDDPEPGGEGEAYVPTEADLAVDLTLFKILDLDYPAFAQIKELYQQKRYLMASEAVLYYFKTRADVINPEVKLPVTEMYFANKKIADDALESGDYRFCVHSGTYYESYNGSTYTYYSFKNSDGSINWEFEAPNAGTEFYQKHWHAWFNQFAQAYNYTGDEKYFEAWKAQYSDWMEKYPCPSSGTTYSGKVGSYGYKSWAELSMATRIENQTELFYYFIKSPGFDFKYLTKFLKMFYDTANYSMSHLYYTENSNIRFAQYKAHCLAGLIFPEFDQSENWLKTGASQVAGHFGISFLEDGCLEEFDLGYHAGEVENYRLVYSAARANNKLGYFPADYLSKMYKACSLIADYIYPNYSWECFNETKSQTKNVLIRWLEQFSDLFPDDAKFKYLASDRQQGTKPTESLTEYRASGWYMFRQDWLENSMMLIYKNHYNPKNMWHSHLDNGNISLYNKGRIFLPGSGSYTYGDNTGGALDEARVLHKAARNHNTITMDLQDIPETNSLGKYLTSSTSENLDMVVCENESYPGFTHRRAVWMVEKSFYVIADAVYGQASGKKVNLSFHLCRDKASNGMGENVVDYDYYETPLTFGAHTTFSDNNNFIFKSFADTADGFERETGTSWFSETIGERQLRKYYRINVNKASASSSPRFITVIVPCGDASSVDISASFVNSAFSTNGEAIRVTVGGKTYDLSYSVNK